MEYVLYWSMSMALSFAATALVIRYWYNRNAPSERKTWPSPQPPPGTNLEPRNAAVNYATQAELDALVLQVSNFFGGARGTAYNTKMSDVCQDVLTDLVAHCNNFTNRDLIPRFEYKTDSRGRNRLRANRQDEREMFADVVTTLRTLLTPIAAVKSVDHDRNAAEAAKDLVILVEFRR